ncbi:MAG TPA: DEAD/DEAH box helicase, partial [Armatimonadota bacterium]|nr:DEAD/DEAH box helicase [Armatimonadota bacterium]
MKPSVPPSLATYWQQLRKPLELEVSRGCPDTAIYGAGIGTYTRLWAQRLQGGSEEDARLAQSIARGLRDYATMPVTERRRRAMAAIDLLRQREGATAATPTPVKKTPRRQQPVVEGRIPAKKREPAPLNLPTGHELLEMPVEQLAPRAKWPRLLVTKLGIHTVRDLLYHIPRDWVEVSPITDLVDGARAALIGTVTRREYDKLHSNKAPHPLYKYTLTVEDDSGEAWVSSISMQPEREGRKPSWSPTKLLFQPGQRIFALGKVDRTGKIIELRMEDIFEVSEAESAELHPGAKVPLYPLTTGVYQSQVNRAVLKALAALGSSESANATIDPLPEEIREQYGLMPLVEALHELHRPRTPIRHGQARKRLAFEEFLVPQLLLAQRRWQQHHHGNAQVLSAGESLPDLVARLVPFDPTPAQLRVLAEIEEDLRSPRPMNRLLQGDVGSGKTLVAAGALAFAVRSGTQAAMMAPTEILAEQLYLVISRLLKPLGIAPVLLTGTQSAPERRVSLQAIATGAAPIAVGTHALIQEGVAFQNLGLSIVDEQHRFGVNQRATLRSKGKTPNALVMTATPIPRTLSLTAYGDL